MKQILGFENEFRFLSNFEGPSVVFEDERYKKVEYAYQAAKTLDLEYRKMIALAQTPGQAKRMGSPRSAIVVRPDWDEVRVPIMKDLMIQKYSVREWGELLLATGEAFIEETNHWHDNFWGSCKCPKCGGNGKNTAGLLSMEIREDLKILEVW